MKSIKPHSLLLLLTLFGLNSVASHASTQPAANTDSQQAIKVTSNTFWANNIKGIAIYSGNVIAEQGSRHLAGEKLTLQRDAQGQVDKITAEGRPATFHSRPKEKLMTAEAKTIIVYPQKHLIHLSGKAKLTQGGDTFSAPQIFYNTETEVLTTPDSKQGRSHMVIEPKSISSATTTPKEKP